MAGAARLEVAPHPFNHARFTGIEEPGPAEKSRSPGRVVSANDWPAVGGDLDAERGVRTE
jgi:hypothetical protein